MVDVFIDTDLCYAHDYLNWNFFYIRFFYKDVNN